LTKVSGCSSMFSMDELEILNFYNNWWLTGKIQSELLKKYHRRAFSGLQIELPYEDYSRIVSLVGPRQTGKTTLLYQLINLLLKKKIDPKRILFLSISDPVFVDNQEFLEKCLETYEKVVLKEQLNNLREPIYVFLDEIQYLKKWELWLKRYYDLNYKIKFIISGSASSRIIEKGRESLAGRISEIKLFPMSFEEFLKLHQSQVEESWKLDSYSLTNYSFLYTFKKPYQELRDYKSFESFWLRIKEKKQEVMARQNLAVSHLHQYMEKGGFPGVYKHEDLSIVYRYLNQDVLERVTAQDIPQIAEIRDVKLLQGLILRVAQRSGSIFSYRNLASESGARSETIRNYLTYLSSAFLIWELWQFRKAEMAKLKANKKFYICDLGLRHSVLKYSTEKIFSSEEKGIGAETLVFNHLNKEEKKISFWRKGDFEVDFVVDKFGFILPIEVKFRKNIAQDDLKGIKKFIGQYKLNGGIVVTDSLLDYQKGIIFIPLWLFLLLC